MSHGGWGCPHEEDGRCRRVKNRPCDPGMKGCILAGRFHFSNEKKNISRHVRDTGGKAGNGKAGS